MSSTVCFFAILVVFIPFVCFCMYFDNLLPLAMANDLLRLALSINQKFLDKMKSKIILMVQYSNAASDLISKSIFSLDCTIAWSF